MFSFSPFLSNCQLPQSTCFIKNTENNVDNNVNIGVLRPCAEVMYMPENVMIYVIFIQIYTHINILLLMV